MTVVSDTSPLNYLVLIGCEELLKVLFGESVVPAAVLRELQSEHAPVAIGNWLGRQPDWIKVRQVDTPESFLPDLGIGEREAIYLAKEIRADALLMDESKGRSAA